MDRSAKERELVKNGVTEKMSLAKTSSDGSTPNNGEEKVLDTSGSPLTLPLHL